MEHFLLNERIASFWYEGKTRELTPTQMKMTGEGIYQAILPKDLEATIRINSVMHGVLEWTVYLENIGTDNTSRISRLLGMDITLPVPVGGNVVWQSLEGDYCNGQSFMPATKALSVGDTHHTEPTKGRASQETAFPYFDMEYNEGGLVCGIGWTGQWQLDMTRGEEGITLQIGQQDSDFYLKPGERARSVRIIVMTGGGIEALRRDFRRMHRKYYSPATKDGSNLRLPIAVQLFDRYYNNLPSFITEEGQLECLTSAAHCTAFDTYWLDAAWFREGFPGGVGNYQFAHGFPNGLKRISEAAHRSGMKFMVWFEPERVYRGSDVFERFDDEAYWLLNAGDASSDTRLFNLGNPEARQWLTNTVSEFIEENGIDIYRQDFNMNPLDYWRTADEDGRRGLTEMRHIEGLYAFWDALLKRFPGLLIDNCASGGRRIDFETCSRSVPLWRSDTACTPDSADKPVAVWHQNQTLNLSRYLPYHCASTWFEDAYQARSGATMGIACAFDFLRDAYDYSLADAATKEIDQIRSSWNGDFYALTKATIDDDVWAAYQLHDENSGFCMIFRRGSSAVEEQTFRLRGLNPDAQYTVFFSDERRKCTEKTLSGSDLLDGITVTIPNPSESLLIKYCEK